MILIYIDMYYVRYMYVSEMFIIHFIYDQIAMKHWRGCAESRRYLCRQNDTGLNTLDFDYFLSNPISG